MKRKKISEADLCRDFISWAEPQGFTAYAETGDWDIVLVRKSDGLQIGVQAKLKFNATLIRQAAPTRYFYEGCSGPDYRAVLLPDLDHEVAEVCHFIGMAHFSRARSWGHGDEYKYHGGFVPSLDSDGAMEHWLIWPTKHRVELPAYVPDVAAGASAPIKLTLWKVSALRITAMMEIKGHVTLEDFREVGMDHRRWVPMQWAKFEDGKYHRGKELGFDRQHPVVYQQILTEERERFERIQSSAQVEPRKRRRGR